MIAASTARPFLLHQPFYVWHNFAQEEVDVDAIKKVFPYGQLLPVEFQRGGMRASSGIELPEMGGAYSTSTVQHYHTVQYYYTKNAVVS